MIQLIRLRRHSMTYLTITLPEPLKDYVDRQIASGTYNTPDEFVAALIEQEQERQAKSQCLVEIYTPRKQEGRSHR